MKRSILSIIALILVLLPNSPMAFAQDPDAALEFNPSATTAIQGQEFDLNIQLKNPTQQNIISVRSWLEYDPSALEGVSVITQDSPFTLSAPGEDAFSPEDGYVKIGRSNISGGVKDADVKVATVRFKVKTASAMTTVISPHDYQVTELGHVSVNIIDQGFPVNILAEKPEAVRISLNSGAATQPPVEVPHETPIDVGGAGFANLNRPQNLEVNTGSQFAQLRWDASTESELVGYNIYYGNVSGQYTRRRNVSNVDHYVIDGLNNGEAYYFAITAYDVLNRESDYSDEVGVIINQPLSATSPFEEIINALLAKIPAYPQNGPLVNWLVFSAIGLSGTILFRKKERI